MIFRSFLVAAGAAGFVISAYMTATLRGSDSMWRRFIPGPCRIDATTCESVLRSPESRLLGIPNSILGAVYYAGLILFGAIGPLIPGTPVYLVATTAAGATFLMSAYLAWSLVFRLKQSCILCFTSHVLNAAVFTFFIVQSSGV